MRNYLSSCAQTKFQAIADTEVGSGKFTVKQTSAAISALVDAKPIKSSFCNSDACLMGHLPVWTQTFEIRPEHTKKENI